MTQPSEVGVSAVRAWWEGLDFAVRRAAMGLWLLGAALGCLSVAIDIAGAWQSFPFLTNMVSALVGASLGVPVALLGIQTLVARQANVAERTRLHQVARTMIVDMRGRVERLGAEPEREDADRDIIDAVNEIRKKSYPPAGLLGGDDQLLIRKAQDIAARRVGLSSMYESWIDGKELTLLLDGLERRWQYLGFELDPRLSEAGISVYSGADFELIGERLTRMQKLAVRLSDPRVTEEWHKVHLRAVLLNEPGPDIETVQDATTFIDNVTSLLDYVSMAWEVRDMVVGFEQNVQREAQLQIPAELYISAARTAALAGDTVSPSWFYRDWRGRWRIRARYLQSAGRSPRVRGRADA